nr:heavy-metal-associated domain-containing protein [Caldicoprobacter guelmensis]
MEGGVSVKKKVFIEGMSCQHCVNHVTEALKEISGVKTVDVDLKGKYAIVEADRQIDDSEIKNAIEEAGYEVVKIE